MPGASPPTFEVVKKTGLFTELKKDGTPEGIARIENIEELLNGMRDFVEEQKEIADTTGSLAEFLEDVALATDLDKETNDEDKVALMTVHLAKGLEFPYVFIVGMEEDLFPSGMSMNTRSELEEERRLFYVAVTRAEKQAYLTYTQSRYRWGKLIDANFFMGDTSNNHLFINNGCDSNSILGDPQFKNPTVGDYTVLNKDALLKLGFVNFDMTHFGVNNSKLKSIAKKPIFPPLLNKINKSKAMTAAFSYNNANEPSGMGYSKLVRVQSMTGIKL